MFFFGGLKASSVTWTSFMRLWRPRDRYIVVFDQKKKKKKYFSAVNSF
jgi:hypothetical protein